MYSSSFKVFFPSLFTSVTSIPIPLWLSIKEHTQKHTLAQCPYTHLDLAACFSVSGALLCVRVCVCVCVCVCFWGQLKSRIWQCWNFMLQSAEPPRPARRQGYHVPPSMPDTHTCTYIHIHTHVGALWVGWLCVGVRVCVGICVCVCVIRCTGCNNPAFCWLVSRTSGKTHTLTHTHTCTLRETNSSLNAHAIILETTKKIPFIYQLNWANIY